MQIISPSLAVCVAVVVLFVETLAQGSGRNLSKRTHNLESTPLISTKLRSTSEIFKDESGGHRASEFGTPRPTSNQLAHTMPPNQGSWSNLDGNEHSKTYVDLQGNLYPEVKKFLRDVKNEVGSVHQSKEDYDMIIRVKALKMVATRDFGDEAKRKISQTVKLNGGIGCFNRMKTIFLPPSFWGLNIPPNEHSTDFRSAWDIEENLLHVEEMINSLHPELSSYEVKHFKQFALEKDTDLKVTMYSEHNWWDEENNPKEKFENLFQEWKSENSYLNVLFHASHVWESFYSLLTNSHLFMQEHGCL
ncbi:hypothetical protein PGT21_008021 [Puccinia graminis f. sp. tritici]|nr:hypothetical protein PGT21_008021 [Puccinia graminis f. sp. tritici]